MTDAKSEFDVARRKLAEFKIREDDLARQRNEIDGRITEISLEMADLTIEAFKKGCTAGVFSPDMLEAIKRAVL
jgi:phage-related minor tail protein